MLYSQLQSLLLTISIFCCKFFKSYKIEFAVVDFCAFHFNLYKITQFCTPLVHPQLVVSSPFQMRDDTYSIVQLLWCFPDVYDHCCIVAHISCLFTQQCLSAICHFTRQLLYYSYLDVIVCQHLHLIMFPVHYRVSCIE